MPLKNRTTSNVYVLMNGHVVTPKSEMFDRLRFMGIVEDDESDVEEWTRRNKMVSPSGG